MVWDVMVAVISVAVLAPPRLKKPHQGISQHRLFALIALPQGPARTQIASHKLKARKTAYAAGF